MCGVHVHVAERSTPHFKSSQMVEDYERARSQSQQASRAVSESNSPALSPQSSHSNLRHHGRPHLRRFRSSLADLAREHKLHSSTTPTNDIRKFFISEDRGEHDHDLEPGYDELNDEFVLLPHHHNQPIDSSDGPSFLYRTGSRVFAQAGLDLGESRHNSPSHSVAHSMANSREVSDAEDSGGSDSDTSSLSSEPDRVIRLNFRDGEESSEEDELEFSSRSAWGFVLRDVLGFDPKRPKTADARRRQREKTTGIFDPALALALIAAFIR